jgi:hypothetical protein
VADSSKLNRHFLGVTQESRKELNLWDFYHKSANCNSSLSGLKGSLRGFDADGYEAVCFEHHPQH